MSNSEEFFSRAQKVIPGGVNSPVRSFSKVGGQPVFIRKAEGAFLFDEDGRELIDYVGSWGPMILGHANPKVIAAVQSAASRGLSYGAPTEIEIRLAEKIISFFPNLDLVRLVSSGTEATMSAIRLARGATNREIIVKFEGCYHGHADSLLVKAGSGALTLGEPDSLGIPKDLAKKTIVLEYNNISSVSELFSKQGKEIAAIIVEPVAGNMGCVPPVKGFLGTLREVCDKNGSLLIFDEVMTGFRVSPGGAQQIYGIKPDLTTLGKILGGGMPVGAFGGKKEIMEQIAPLGGIYQAGTLSGNPLAMQSGLATLDMLEDHKIYESLENRSAILTEEMKRLAEEVGIPFQTNRVGSMFSIFFTKTNPVTKFADVLEADNIQFVKFFRGMLEKGIYLAPSPFESGFVSIEHSDQIIKTTLEAAKKTFKEIGNT